MSIQAGKVDTELQATVLFPHQHHCVTPSALARPDSTRFQHFAQVVLNLLHQQWGNSSKLFFKGSVIRNFYRVFPWNGYNPIPLYPMRTHHGIQSGANEQHLPAWEAHKSRPLKSNLSNSLPCLCLMISLGVWGSWDSSAPFSNCSSSGGLGMGDTATTLATGVFFQRVCKYAVLFLTTATAFLLLGLNSVYVFCIVRPCSKEPSSLSKACTMMLICSPV